MDARVADLIVEREWNDLVLNLSVGLREKILGVHINRFLEEDVIIWESEASDSFSRKCA